MNWLRRRFIAGFFVTVPLFISVAALVWLFRVVDGLTAPVYVQLLGRRIPGLGIATTAVGRYSPMARKAMSSRFSSAWRLASVVPSSQRMREVSGWVVGSSTRVV